MNEDHPLAWPKTPDKARIQRYEHADKLYRGEHYDAFAIQGSKDFTDRYKKLRYIVANFAKITSNVMADMLFGENFTVDVKDNGQQAFLAAVMESNDLMSQLWESATGASRRGDACFKLRVGKRHPSDEKETIIIEEFTPAIYFPTLAQTMTRNVPTEDVIATVRKINNKTYLHKEIHTPGLIVNEVYSYNPAEQRVVGQVDASAMGLNPTEDTGVKRSLIFHVPNVRDSSGYWGTGDYQDIESLLFALNNRLTKTDNILDKHSDPILAVPPGVLDDNGRVRKEELGMFEVDNENPGFNKPEYIVWNANLQSAETEVDKLIDMLYMFSEVAPSTLGLDKNGVAESGRALKFRMIATIRKKNRKMRYYDMALKYMLLTAQELAVAKGVSVEGLSSGAPEKPQILWSNRIVNDEVEGVDIATARLDNGTMSKVDAIASLDGLSPDDAKKKAKEIEDENAAGAPALQNNVTGTGTGGAGGMMVPKV